jgi:hypothetical protein
MNQYHVYIFVGQAPTDIMNILKKFKDKSLYDTLISLSTKEYQTLSDYYGKIWFNKFFNFYHIYFTVTNITQSKSKMKELISKYGQKWFDFIKHNFIPTTKKIFYSYEAVIKKELEYKQRKKIVIGAPKEKEINDFRIVKQKQVIQSGGAEESDGFDEGLEATEMFHDEETDMDEIEKLYKTDDTTDQNVKQTTKLIKEAVKDTKIFTKTESGMVDFDQSKDEQMYDEHLKDVFIKYYITNQYIHKDDTISDIKSKICCGFYNNPKFCPKAYFVPSRVYLWSEYLYDKEVKKISVGQKWIRKNELLKIDIEPNKSLRWYENLEDKLKLLRDNLKRYASKIKYEDDNNNILLDYEEYTTNNEIYMIDAYNEFGLNYQPTSDARKNLLDVYLKLYYHKMHSDDLKSILDFLKGSKKSEIGKMEAVYQTLNNDLVMINEISRVVDEVRDEGKYKKYFKQNYITQSTIHLVVRTKPKSRKLELHRIFDQFILTKKYPFVQYQTSTGQGVFKSLENDIFERKNSEEMNIVSKWFENAPYGISFKMRTANNRFMAISLNDVGRVEYKTQYKEKDEEVIDNIKKTYEFVRNLIKKINAEESGVEFEEPLDEEFHYAFINTIQQFELPNKHIIDHNDLSEFSRYFFPYVALVIEPRKRQSKTKSETTTSKYGTYVRYRRVSKYDNQVRIEQRILYFMRNYEYNDKSLSSEISKQFNITIEKSIIEIERVRKKYPIIKKSRKILRKMENFPKYKPPGIGVDIQGKQRDKYKIRISGARNKNQLERIISFINILLYLYFETYLLKKKDRQAIKEKLKGLHDIAKRRHLVVNIVRHERTIKTIKQMAQVDKERIGFKPEKGQNPWSRACQNSGNDKRRRPQLFQNMRDFIKKGFKMNKKTGLYERESTITERGKKKKVVLRAVKFKVPGKNGAPDTEKEIHYTCGPEKNGQHMFIGFLTRSSNPYGHCMPCCFIKDPLLSKNKRKREFFLNCIGELDKKEDSQQSIVGDLLYILQDTNKIQTGRLGFLPKYMDYFFNLTLNKTRKIRHHNLLAAKDGFFFKMGIEQNDYPFISAVALAFGTPIETIINKMISVIDNDKQNQIFTALNNGDIRTRFKNREDFINYIRSNTFLDFQLFNDLLSLPKTLEPQGLNIIVFKKQSVLVKKSLEKEHYKDDFVIMCQNIENLPDMYNDKRKTLFLLKENKNYYPIVLVTKPSESDKNVKIDKFFNFEKTKENIVNHVMEFYKHNCIQEFIKGSHLETKGTIAKHIIGVLQKLPKEYQPKGQIIDTRNKCKFILTKNSILVPVTPSGSIHNLPIFRITQSYLLPIQTLYGGLVQLDKLTKGELSIKPTGVYHDKKKSTADKIFCTGMITEEQFHIPVLAKQVSLKWIKEHRLHIEDKPLYDYIDVEIEKGENNIVVDDRIYHIAEDKYYHESYQLFRLEFSKFIIKPENVHMRDKLKRIISNPKLTQNEKSTMIKTILYRLLDKDLYQIFNEYFNKQSKSGGGKPESFVNVIMTLPSLRNYDVNNNRKSCRTIEDKATCSSSTHCHWAYSQCKLALSRDNIVNFVNKISDELVFDELKRQELFEEKGYYVSDIVKYDKYIERPGQRIVKSTNATIKKILSDLFGKDNVPKIGRRRRQHVQEIDYRQLNIDHPLQETTRVYIQDAIEQNLTIFRAYTNCFYWLSHPYFPPETRNLGYYSDMQTSLANYFKSATVDWLLNKKNYEIVNGLMKYVEIKKKKTLPDFITKISTDMHTLTNGIVELSVLSYIYQIPILIYELSHDVDRDSAEEDQVIYIFSNGMKYNRNIHKHPSDKIKKTYLTHDAKKQSIVIRFKFISKTAVPDEVESLYVK